MIMIDQHAPKNQLPEEIKPAFNELKILKHLRNAGFKKHFGYSCSYLFQIVFILLMKGKKIKKVIVGSRKSYLITWDEKTPSNL